MSKTQLASHREHARRMGLPATLTKAEWEFAIAYFNGLCAYCLAAPYEVIEHYVPARRGGGTTMDNCVPACARCNTVKSESRSWEMSLACEARVAAYFAWVRRAANAHPWEASPMGVLQPSGGYESLEHRAREAYQNGARSVDAMQAAMNCSRSTAGGWLRTLRSEDTADRLREENLALRAMLAQMIDEFECEVHLGNTTIAKARALLAEEKQERAAVAQ